MPNHTNHLQNKTDAMFEILDLKLWTDSRGFVAWPLLQDLVENDRFRGLHVPSLKPGAVRGNHYHRHKTEYVLVLCGPCRARFQRPQTGETAELILAAEQPELIRIAPGTAHAFINETDRDIFLICYYEAVKDSPDPDLKRLQIL